MTCDKLESNIGMTLLYLGELTTRVMNHLVGWSYGHHSTSSATKGSNVCEQIFPCYHQHVWSAVFFWLGWRCRSEETTAQCAPRLSTENCSLCNIYTSMLDNFPEMRGKTCIVRFNLAWHPVLHTWWQTSIIVSSTADNFISSSKKKVADIIWPKYLLIVQHVVSPGTYSNMKIWPYLKTAGW